MNEAKAAATVAAAAADHAPAVTTQRSVAQGLPRPAAAGGKKALGAMLRKAAQKMQEQEASAGPESATASATALATASTPRDKHSSLATHNAPDEKQQQSATTANMPSSEQAHSSVRDTSVSAEGVQSSGLSLVSSHTSTVGLLPTEANLRKPPIRHQSLGERLGSILKGALSLPRQSAFIPLAQVDRDDGSGERLTPGSRSALPRAASYLPEWLNQTLGLASQTSGSAADALENPRFASEGLLSGLALEDSSDLPQWVDWSALKAQGEDQAAGGASVRHSPATLALPHQDPPWESSDAAPEPATPKGQRLFQFWQQKSAAGSPGADGSGQSGLASARVKGHPPEHKFFLDTSQLAAGLVPGPEHAAAIADAGVLQTMADAQQQPEVRQPSSFDSPALCLRGDIC